MPASENRKIVIVTASPGDVLEQAARTTRSRRCRVRRATAMTTANAPRFIARVDEQVDDDGLERRVLARRASSPATANGTSMKPPCAIDE